MSYRSDWADQRGHLWVITNSFGLVRSVCWFCLSLASSSAAKKPCKRNK